MVFEVDVVVKVLYIDVRVVLEGDAGVRVERHREVGNEGAAFDRGCGEREGLVDVARAPALAEEIADRGFDARVFLVVPVHAEDEISAAVGVVMVERAPNVGDDSGVVHLGEGDGGSGRNWDVVAISAGAVVARNSVRRCVDELGDVCQRTLTHFTGMLSQRSGVGDQ